MESLASVKRNELVRACPELYEVLGEHLCGIGCTKSFPAPEVHLGKEGLYLDPVVEAGSLSYKMRSVKSSGHGAYKADIRLYPKVFSQR